MDVAPPPTDPAALGRWLATLRHRSGLTQAALAAAAGTSQPAVARSEAGGGVPSWRTLDRIARALGRELHVRAAPAVDEHDLDLARQVRAMTVEERLATLTSWAALAAATRESIPDDTASGTADGRARTA